MALRRRGARGARADRDGRGVLGPRALLVPPPRGVRRRARRSIRAAVALALYVTEAAAVVLALGLGLPRALGLGVTFLTDEGSLVVAGVLFAIGGWGLGRDIDVELRLEDARLKAVRAHLDPHFLYNTLNAIAEWCAEDPKVAEEATLRLAAMMRDVLEALELETWPLSRELSLTRDLLELHRVRDAGAFTASVDVDDAEGDAHVVPLALLTLVENALKHGPRKGHRGAIEIRVVKGARGVRVVVESPGPFAPVPGARTAGLPTLERRLALAHGARARLVVGPADAPARTRATLDLPSRAA
ncbi:MAG: histidine kinase [Polyangiaceae bacterium]